MPLEVKTILPNIRLEWYYNPSEVRKKTNYGMVTFELHLRKKTATDDVRGRIREILENAFARNAFTKRQEFSEGTIYRAPNIFVSHHPYRQMGREPEIQISMPRSWAENHTFLKEALDRLQIPEWKAPEVDPNRASSVISKLLPDVIEVRAQRPIKRRRKSPNRLLEDEDPN